MNPHIRLSAGSQTRLYILKTSKNVENRLFFVYFKLSFPSEISKILSRGLVNFTKSNDKLTYITFEFCFKFICVFARERKGEKKRVRVCEFEREKY